MESILSFLKDIFIGFIFLILINPLAWVGIIIAADIIKSFSGGCE